MAKNNANETDYTAALEEVEVVVPPTETTRAVMARNESAKTFVYVGPSLPGGKLKSNTVLSGTHEEIAKYFEEALALYPLAARLIVPAARLAEAREKLQSDGNSMFNQYAALVAAIGKKGVEE